MKYRDLQIQTHREAPNNARTQGFAFLVRAGYLTRENTPTPLGKYALKQLSEAASEALTSLSTAGNDAEIFFPLASGDVEVAHCPNCKYTERLEVAQYAKSVFSQE
jgi:hypothetical protein